MHQSINLFQRLELGSAWTGAGGAVTEVPVAAMPIPAAAQAAAFAGLAHAAIDCNPVGSVNVSEFPLP